MSGKVAAYWAGVFLCCGWSVRWLVSGTISRQRSGAVVGLLWGLEITSNSKAPTPCDLLTKNSANRNLLGRCPSKSEGLKVNLKGHIKKARGFPCQSIENDKSCKATIGFNRLQIY